MCEHTFASMGRGGSRYTEAEPRAAIAAARSYSDALRRLGMRPAGGNHATLKRLVERLGISTSHFDPDAAKLAALRARNRSGAMQLSAILVRGSTYSRGSLKRRLYAEGLTKRECELCGQCETWQGRQMALIL